ncbi:hypothetical protein M1D34_29540 (plasmid) [Ensifer sp. D2-11]
MTEYRHSIAIPLLAFATLIATPALSQAPSPSAEADPCRAVPGADQKPLTQKLDDCNGVIRPPKVGDTEIVEPTPDVGKSRVIRPGDLPAQQSGAGVQ